VSPRKVSILFVGPMLGANPGFVPNPMEALGPRLAAEGYGTILTSRRVNRWTRFADITREIVTPRRSYDLVCLQVYSGRSFLVEDWASGLSRAFGKPLVNVLHGGDFPSFISRFPGWTRSVLGRAARTVTPSAYLAEAVRPLGIEATVIPNMIDLGLYPARVVESPRPRILWMRAFHEVYGPRLAVAAFRLVLREFPEATMTMAGQDKGLLAATRREVEETGLSDAVTFPGFVSGEAKLALLSSHDILVNSNRIDNMPVTVVEGCASGIPVVSTRVGGIPFLLEDGETGLLVPYGDAAAMAGAICRLLRERGLAERLSRAGRALAESCAWEAVRPAWIDLFDGLAAG
jgi:L-malate glycosyltransferase